MGPVGQSLHTFAQLGKTRASRSTFQRVMVIVRSLGSDLLRRLTGGDVRSSQETCQGMAFGDGALCLSCYGLTR